MDFLQPTYIYLTYSYQEAMRSFLRSFQIIYILAFISMIICWIFGVRKKDSLVILVTNIMVKTLAMGLYQIFGAITKNWNIILSLEIVLIFILYTFIAITIIEGCIYNKILQNKKNNGIRLSSICNIILIPIFLIIINILPN